MECMATGENLFFSISLSPYFPISPPLNLLVSLDRGWYFFVTFAFEIKILVDHINNNKITTHPHYLGIPIQVIISCSSL